jgi:ribulose-5-phosphate 4-epimerase/fuculose-1-phosphate aldolase
MSDVAFWGQGNEPALQPFRSALRAEWERRGYEFVEGQDPNAACVFNFIDPADPKPFRRRQRSTYVIAVHHLADRPEDVLRAEYPMLVRALANIAMLVVPGDACYFVTPEQGFYSVPDPGDPEAWVKALFDRIEPLATSRLVIDNHFETDLEPELWDGDEQTEGLFRAGRRLDALGLLPAPFPLEDLVTPDDMRWIKLVYGIGGLSYGNLSARKDDRRFWMSASGVDKSNLREIGRDILLVTDYDRANERMVLSVPPGVEPRRASVDAIEHWMIYQAHPDVGAILHVHAWMEGIAATDVNYPCGTQQLAVAVADLVAQEPDPAHAVIGLRNHGLTCTGDSLSEILDRVAPKVLRQVPMS